MSGSLSLPMLIQGTSYTLANVEKMSQTTTATNYGGDNDPCLPVHSGWENGPFWHRPERDRAPKESFVLTKTHCGGYCMDCGPKAYLHTGDSFEEACTTGAKHVEDGHETVSYDSALIQRAVHLFRDPFDNIVGRMHLAIDHKGDDPSVAAYTNDQQGLEAWCSYLDRTFAAQEAESPLQQILRIQYKDLPCHAEWFRYVQWHNRAYEVTRQRLGVDVHYLFYENYTTNFDETVQEIFDFLHLPVRDTEPQPFYSGKSYGNFYSENHARRAAHFVRRLALPPVWAKLKHYFKDELLEEKALAAIDDEFDYSGRSAEVTWLMSFPNSVSGTNASDCCLDPRTPHSHVFSQGTSYTMMSVEQAGSASVASNYAADFERLVPVRPELVNGPFLHKPHLGLPPRRVLSKTHCTAYCADCGPEEYVVNLDAFTLGCQTSTAPGPDGTKVRVAYEPSVPSSIIHIFRSPFDNLVARFHLGTRLRPEGDQLHGMNSTKEDFHKWCKTMEQPYRSAVQNSNWMSAAAKKYVDAVPCFGDLYRYIQWHNYGLEMIHRLDVPVQYLYYESYTSEFNATFQSVLDFLEIDPVASPVDFLPGKTYESFYEPEEAQAVAHMVEDLASEKLWTRIKHYFETQ